MDDTVWEKVVRNILLSNTQRLLVGVIRLSGNQGLRVGIQKFWRKSKDEEDWVAGKGFYLDIETAGIVSLALKESVKILKDMENEKSLR